MEMEFDMERCYTADEFLEGIREYNRICELYDGKVFLPPTPDMEYHDIRGSIFTVVRIYIKKNVPCYKVLLSPLDVRMDEHNVVQPDLLVICNKSKLDDKRCYGSPEFVIAVTSDERCEKDYINKLYLYEKYGAEEYWIIDPRYKKVISYLFAKKSENGSVPFEMCGFDEDISVSTFNDKLTININKLMDEVFDRIGQKTEINADNSYTADEFLEEIPKNNSICELYDGKIFISPTPDTEYHRIRDNLLFEINTYIKENKRKCEIFSAPFDVRMDDHNVVKPDLLVICNKTKLDDKRCYGSPEFVIAVTSDERCEKDYINKLYLYGKYGAEEYWIVDPRYKKVISYRFADKNEDDSVPFKMFGFDDDIPVSIFNDDLKININMIKERRNNFYEQHS